MRVLLPLLPFWDLAGGLGKHAPTPLPILQRSWLLTCGPPFLPSSHCMPVPVQDVPASRSSTPHLRPRGPRAACQVVAHARGSSLLGVNDALSPAVLPLVLLFLPPPAHSRQGLDLGAMPLCCCQGSREPDPSYAGKRPGLSKCLR